MTYGQQGSPQRATSKSQMTNDGEGWHGQGGETRASPLGALASQTAIASRRELLLCDRRHL